MATRIKYESNNGQIHGGLMDADRAAVAGDEPDGDVTSNILIKISKTNREVGIRPRGVRLSRTIGTGDETFNKYSFLPVLNPTDYEGDDFSIGTEISIGDNTWTVIGKQGEDY